MYTGKKITAKLHPSGFTMSDSNFYSLSVLNDNDVYYTLCTHNIDTHGRVYRYDPKAGSVKLFADLGVITGEAGKKNLPHGKSHTPIFEMDGKIYFATHYGYYQGNDGKEEPAPPPEGYHPYPGGKIIEYDKAAGSFEVLAGAPPEEGIITMNMDTDRKIMYCLTWPKGIFMYYDIGKRKLKVIGPVSRGGEVGLGDNYFCLCRVLAIDPRDGTVYFTNPDGEILKFHTDDDTVKPVAWASMKKDIFGCWDPHKGGHQGYNWRQIIWNPKYEKFFGVHGKSGYLFSFDPKNEEMEVIDRICCERCRKSGDYESFRYGYLTLALDPRDNETFYYISGFDQLENIVGGHKWSISAQGEYKKTDEYDENIRTYLTLTTYNLSSGKYMDHGVIELEDGRYPTLTQAIAIHPDGRIYTCPWIPEFKKNAEGKTVQHSELISFENPLKSR